MKWTPVRSMERRRATAVLAAGICAFAGCGERVKPRVDTARTTVRGEKISRPPLDPKHAIERDQDGGAPDGAPAVPTDICLARGGRIVEVGSRHHDKEGADVARVCRGPDASGRACSGNEDCAGGVCRCKGALAKPQTEPSASSLHLDGTRASGVCSEERLPSGKWICTVQDGTVHVRGIIID